MKRSFFLFWLLLVGVGACSLAVADELPDRQHVELWTRSLLSNNTSVRENADYSLIRAAWSSIESGWENGQRRNRCDAERFRRALKASRPELVTTLRQSSLESPETLPAGAITCLAIVSEDGSVLRSVMSKELRGHPLAELSAIQTLLWTTLYTMPEDTAALPSVLRDIRHMSLESRHSLDSAWGDIESESSVTRGIQLSLVGMAHVLIETNRTLTELPYLIESLDDQYPDIVRYGAVNVLANMGEEASSSVPALQTLLKEDSLRIRVAAASAMLCIQRDFEKAGSLAAEANLDGVERDRFLNLAITLEKECLSNECSPRVAGVVVAQALSSPYGFYQRQGLRLAIRFGGIPDSAQSRLRDLLRSPDPATRDLAKRVAKKTAIRPRK